MDFFPKLITRLCKELEVRSWGLRAWILHYGGVIYARKFRAGSNLKLHLACGDKIKEGWVNIDINRKCDLTLDLRKRLPFLKDSCAIIYCEHFLEHLDYPSQATFFLKECCRILKPGGILSVGVPDAEWAICDYLEKDETGYFKFAKEKWHPKWCVTRMEHINYHFRQDGTHRFAYDFETLKRALEICGFDEVKRRDFNSELDSEDRKLGTLYVVAIKPIH